MGRLGARKGVIRGNDSSGAIYVNGHYPVPPLTRAAILGRMHQMSRAVTPVELAAELHLSASHVQRAMRYMAREHPPRERRMSREPVDLLASS